MYAGVYIRAYFEGVKGVEACLACQLATEKGQRFHLPCQSSLYPSPLVFNHCTHLSSHSFPMNTVGENVNESSNLLPCDELESGQLKLGYVLHKEGGNTCSKTRRYL